MTTAALKPIKVRHVLNGENVFISWTIEHWNSDEKRSILYYEVDVSLTKKDSRKRREDSADLTGYICYDSVSDSISAKCSTNLEAGITEYKFNVDC